ncbi:hypothetical protein ABWC92_004592 [Escherichia coli]
MAQLKQLTREQFEALSWSVGDVILNGFEHKEASAFAWGSIIIKQTADLFSEEGDENLPLIWFDFTVNFTKNEKDIVNIEFEELQEDPYGLNLITFCEADISHVPQLIEAVVVNSKWQDQVIQNIKSEIF